MKGIIKKQLAVVFKANLIGLTDVSAVTMTDALLECSVIATGKNKQYFIISKPFLICCYRAT